MSTANRVSPRLFVTVIENFAAEQSLTMFAITDEKMSYFAKQVETSKSKDHPSQISGRLWYFLTFGSMSDINPVFNDLKSIIPTARSVETFKFVSHSAQCGI